MDALQATNRVIKTRGVRGRIVVAKNRLFLRGTFTDSHGVRKDRRVPLSLPVESLLEAENRAVSLAGVVNTTEMLPATLPWDIPVPSIAPKQSTITVADAVERLKVDFWQGKIRTSAAERTLARFLAETARLPQQATFTMDLLVAVGEQQQPGSRTGQ